MRSFVFDIIFTKKPLVKKLDCETQEHGLKIVEN